MIGVYPESVTLEAAFISTYNTFLSKNISANEVGRFIGSPAEI